MAAVPQVSKACQVLKNPRCSIYDSHTHIQDRRHFSVLFEPRSPGNPRLHWDRDLEGTGHGDKASEASKYFMTSFVTAFSYSAEYPAIDLINPSLKPFVIDLTIHTMHPKFQTD